MVFFHHLRGIRPVVGSFISYQGRKVMNSRVEHVRVPPRFSPSNLTPEKALSNTFQKSDFLTHQLAMGYALADVIFMLGTMLVFLYESGYCVPKVGDEENTVPGASKDWDFRKSIERTISAAKARASFGSVLSSDEALHQMTEAVVNLKDVIMKLTDKVVALEKKLETIEKKLSKENDDGGDNQTKGWSFKGWWYGDGVSKDDRVSKDGSS